MLLAFAHKLYYLRLCSKLRIFMSKDIEILLILHFYKYTMCCE